MRCVIVDDNEAFLEVSRVVLERDGVEVVGMARNVVDGIVCARVLEPDVILVDVELGDERGIEFASRLAREPDTAATQLILMSAHGEDEITDLIEGDVAVGFLAKTALSKQAIEALLARGRADGST